MAHGELAQVRATGDDMRAALLAPIPLFDLKGDQPSIHAQLPRPGLYRDEGLSASHLAATGWRVRYPICLRGCIFLTEVVSAGSCRLLI